MTQKDMLEDRATKMIVSEAVNKMHSQLIKMTEEPLDGDGVDELVERIRVLLNELNGNT